LEFFLGWFGRLIEIGNPENKDLYQRLLPEWGWWKIIGNPG
jgi:hypothetical protein